MRRTGGTNRHRMNASRVQAGRRPPPSSVFRPGSRKKRTEPRPCAARGFHSVRSLPRIADGRTSRTASCAGHGKTRQCACLRRCRSSCPPFARQSMPPCRTRAARQQPNVRRTGASPARATFASVQPTGPAGRTGTSPSETHRSPHRPADNGRPKTARPPPGRQSFRDGNGNKFPAPLPAPEVHDIFESTLHGRLHALSDERTGHALHRPQAKPDA